MAQKYEQLLLKNQLCFPLYACGRKVIESYNPYLKPLGLTYTQYLRLYPDHQYETLSPESRYVNREEDMGLPGLRKSKESYFPISKFRKWRFIPAGEI